MIYLIMFLYFAIPIASVVYFIYSLLSYVSIKKQCAAEPDAVAPKTLKSRKIQMIISGIVMAVLVSVTVGFAVLLILAIAYM